MRFFPKPPAKGMPWSSPGIAAGLAGIEKALAQMRVYGGRVSWSAGGVPTIITQGGDGGDSYKKPFSISFAMDEAGKTTVTVSYILYSIGMIYYMPVTQEITLNTLPDSNAQFLGAELMFDGTGATLIKGATFASVNQTEAPDPTAVKSNRPLYLLKSVKDPVTNFRTWGVDEDYRDALVTVAWN